MWPRPVRVRALYALATSSVLRPFSAEPLLAYATSPRTARVPAPRAQAISSVPRRFSAGPQLAYAT